MILRLDLTETQLVTLKRAIKDRWCAHGEEGLLPVMRAVQEALDSEDHEPKGIHYLGDAVPTFKTRTVLFPGGLFKIPPGCRECGGPGGQDCC